MISGDRHLDAVGRERPPDNSRARVVDQHVETPILLMDLCGQRADRFERRHVRDLQIELRRSRLASNILERLPTLFLIPADEHNARAHAREPEGGLLSDAAVRPCDTAGLSCHLAARYLRLATCGSLLAARYLRLASCYSLLATRSAWCDVDDHRSVT